MENDEENQNNQNKKSSVVIRIPSYQEVVESSQTRSTPPSLFVPSQTFSEAFAFVKSSEFYSPPPSLPKYSHFSFLLLLIFFPYILLLHYYYSYHFRVNWFLLGKIIINRTLYLQHRQHHHLLLLLMFMQIHRNCWILNLLKIVMQFLWAIDRSNAYIN
jgi:hypothetical protein